MKIFKNIAILSTLLFVGLANAHSGLKNSTPKSGASLNQAPESMLLEFTAPVKLIKLQLEDQAGKATKLTSSPSKTFKKAFNIEVPKLEMGTYKVKWVTMGKDAHKMKGYFTFILHTSEMQKAPMNSDDIITHIID